MHDTLTHQMSRLQDVLEETGYLEWGEQVFNTAPTGLMLVDADGLIDRANPELCYMFGYDYGALSGKPLQTLLPERFREKHPELQQNYQKNPKKRTMGAGRDLFGQRKDGSEVPVEIGLNPVVLSGRKMILASVVDISQRKQIEQDFQRIVEAMPNGVLVLDADGTITNVNAELARMFGYEKPEILGRKIEILLPEEYRAKHIGQRDGYLQTPDKRAMGAGRDLFGRRKDGTQFPVEIGLNPLPSEDGASILASVVDISSRKRMEKLFGQIIESAPQGMLMIDGNAIITMVNQRLCNLFGYPSEDIVGQPIEHLLPERYRAEHVGIRTAFIADPTLRPMGAGRDLTALHCDGTEFPVEIGLSPLETEQGHLILASVTDITRRKSAQHMLQQANHDLEEFTSVASHDLRSPLRGIANLLHWIDEDLGEEKPAQVVEHIDRAIQRVQRMERLIDDLLSYARAGQADTDAENIDIEVAIDEILELIAPDSAFTITKNLQVKSFTGSRIPLETCIRNLVSNALKHHDKPEGHIDISCTEEAGFCVFRITDDGPGISPSVHERIFKLFQMLNKSRSDSTGLGLAITKRLIESHGGSIFVESQEDARGTTFVFRWPMFHRRDLERSIDR